MKISFNTLGNTGIKVRRQKFGLGAFIILVLLGIAFTAFGLFIVRSSQIDKSWIKVRGEVVEVSSTISQGSTLYTPIIKYEVNGQSHRITPSSSSSFYPTGSHREVAYNPARPNEAKVIEGTGTKLLLLAFPAIGMLLLVLAPILFFRSIKRSQRISNLTQTGQKLQGVITDIQSTGSTNGNNVYRIVVSAVDPAGATQNYKSDSLAGVAGLAMADFRNNPIPIDVYIDPADPKNYYVDISDIPNLTPERIGELIKSAISNARPTTMTQPAVPSQIPPAPQTENKPPLPPPTVG